MKRWLLAVMICACALTGCGKENGDSESQKAEESLGTSAEMATAQPVETVSETEAPAPPKERVKVKGIYISGYMAGSSGFDAILEKIEETEINAVVIDVKNDDGRITFAMEDAPTVNEIGATEKYISDIDALMAECKERGIYTIARVVAFRDPYLAEKKPEWSLKDADGSLHRDNKGLAWVNPYKTEVWDYLVEVGRGAAKAGFDEIQFDYIRFATDKTMKNVVFDEADTKGRSKTDIITEFISYAYEKLSAEKVFVAADVFGAIIGNKIDADAVGQIYNEMARHLDYICPMIYPSHYGDGNFGIEHPDTQPYETILAALQKSKQDLYWTGKEDGHQAIVRPWLQDFTASYLKNHIKYGPKEIRAQIQAVYDAGYDEWILWSASNKYTWAGLLTPEDAVDEEMKIAESRAALPPETSPPAPSTQAPEPEQSSDPASSGEVPAASALQKEGESVEASLLAQGLDEGGSGQSQGLSEAEPMPETGAAAPENVTQNGTTAGEETVLAGNSEAEAEGKAGKEKPPVVIVTTGADQDY